MKKRLILTTIAILLPAILFVIAGCMKAPSTIVDKGPEVLCATLDNAIADIQRPSVLGIQKAEFAYLESTARIESLTPELTQQYAVTVMDRQENANSILLTIREETREKVDGQFKTSIKEGPALIAKTGSTTQAATLSKSLGVQEVSQKLRILTGSAGVQGANCASQKAGTVKSFHNLSVSDFDIPVPQAVQVRTGCGGLTNCQGPIPGKTLKFDRWIDDPNSPGQELKVTTYIVTAPSVPFFATIFSQCVQYSWPVQNRQVLVTSCDDVKDFKFGTP